MAQNLDIFAKKKKKVRPLICLICTRFGFATIQFFHKHHHFKFYFEAFDVIGRELVVIHDFRFSKKKRIEQLSKDLLFGWKKIVDREECPFMLLHTLHW